MPQNVDPKVDYAFKKLFGSERNKPLLIDMLSSILKEEIVDVVLLNPYNPREFTEDKESILDVQAEFSDGRIVVVEMQIWLTAQYPKRMLYYWAKPFVRQIGKGEPYGTLKPVIAIHFVNEVMFAGKTNYHECFRIVADSDPSLVLTPLFEMHVIELPKFLKADDELANSEERWCYFLKNAPMLDKNRLPEGLKMRTIEQAMEELDIMGFSEQDRIRYDNRMMWLSDQASNKIDSRIEGKLEGKLEMLNVFRDSIETGVLAKFGVKSSPVIEKIHAIRNEVELKEIILKLVTSPTLEEFQQAIG